MTYLEYLLAIMFQPKTFNRLWIGTSGLAGGIGFIGIISSFVTEIFTIMSTVPERDLVLEKIIDLI
jgi:hypothetical protein